MIFIPYVAFSVATSDTAEAIGRRLSENIDRTSWFPKLPYIGKVWDSGFKVLPIVRYRNSFMPVICGRFEPAPSGTIVQVTMRIHWAVIIFMCGWCGGVVVGGFNMLVQPLAVGEPIWGPLFATLFMLLFAAGLTVWAFWSEVPQRRDDVTRILLGNEPRRPPGDNCAK
jgi:hypothetical protein